MRISAINNFAYTQKAKTNFNGLLINKGETYTKCDNDLSVWIPEMPDSSSVETFHQARYTYYPFKNESQKSIDKALKDNNYMHTYKDESYQAYDISTTELGKALPYTEKEWNSFSEDKQKEISLLLSL